MTVISSVFTSTSTSVTSTLSSGQVFTTEPTSSTSSTTITAPTTTVTVTSFAYSTSVTTSSTETTATTFSTYTFGPNVQKRDLEPISNPFEPGPTPGALLGVIPSIISAACSCALNLRTTTVKTISTTSTTTVASTIQLTSVSTATVPTTTVTIFSTIVIPYDTTITPVVSTTLPSTIITTSTTTAVATTFVCPLQSEIDGGGIGVGNSGQLNEITGVSTSLSCCEACYSTAGCGLWLYFDDFGYFTGVNAIGPNVNTMCPTGYGAYITISSGGVSGDFGGQDLVLDASALIRNQSNSHNL